MDEKAFEHLDSILIYVCGQQRQWVDYSDLQTIISDQVALLNYLQILEEEKFVVVRQELNGRRFYWATPQGRIFILRGGYMEQDRKTNEDRQRINSLEETRKAQETTLVWLTGLIALGTLIAGWYYLTELCEYYHWTNCFCK